jgi:hypothetical protein
LFELDIVGVTVTPFTVVVLRYFVAFLKKENHLAIIDADLPTVAQKNKLALPSQPSDECDDNTT